MTFALVGLAILAALALSGWVMAELDLRMTERALDVAEDDLRIALGFDDVMNRREAVVLHAIEGGKA